MKLLLDEMLSAVVAEQLRGRGRDVEAVSQRRQLRGLTDRDLFEYAQSGERSLVTYNRDDFLELDRSRFALRCVDHRRAERAVPRARSWPTKVLQIAMTDRNRGHHRPDR